MHEVKTEHDFTSEPSPGREWFPAESLLGAVGLPTEKLTGTPRRRTGQAGADLGLRPSRVSGRWRAVTHPTPQPYRSRFHMRLTRPPTAVPKRRQAWSCETGYQAEDRAPPTSRNPARRRRLLQGCTATARSAHGRADRDRVRDARRGRTGAWRPDEDRDGGFVGPGRRPTSSPNVTSGERSYLGGAVLGPAVAFDGPHRRMEILSRAPALATYTSSDLSLMEASGLEARISSEGHSMFVRPKRARVYGVWRAALEAWSCAGRRTSKSSRASKWDQELSNGPACRNSEEAGLIKALPAQNRRHPIGLRPKARRLRENELSESAWIAKLGLKRLAGATLLVTSFRRSASFACTPAAGGTGTATRSETLVAVPLFKERALKIQ